MDDNMLARDYEGDGRQCIREFVERIGGQDTDITSDGGTSTPGEAPRGTTTAATAPANAERRRGPRYALVLPVEIRHESRLDQVIPGTVRDISSDGVRITTKAFIPPGALVRIRALGADNESATYAEADD